MNCVDSSDNPLSCTPTKQIKLSQQISQHPGRFVGAGTSSTAAIESCVANQFQTPKQVRASSSKKLGKFSPVHYIKAPSIQPKNGISNAPSPVNRHNVAKKLFETADNLDDEDESPVDPLLGEELGQDLSYRVRNFTYLLTDVLGDSSTFHLIDSEELNVVSKFLNMPSHCKELYILMFNRKHKWHQVSNIKYALNLIDMFKELESYGFVTSDIKSENLDFLLDMLKVADLKKLCKDFNLKLGALPKPELKRALLNYAKSQRTLFSSDSADVIKAKIPNLLGYCIRLCDDARKLFHRINVLFSLPFSGEDDVEAAVLHNSLHINYVEMGKMVYPTFNITKTMPLFATKDMLSKYEEAVVMENKLSNVIAKNDVGMLKILSDEALHQFRTIVQNESHSEHVLKLPVFLRCFTSGSVYAKILFVAAQKLRAYDEFCEYVTQILGELLKQTLYHPQHRGYWYDLLVSIFRTKSPVAAAKTVIQALNDPELDDLQRYTLSQRGSQLLAGKKKPLPVKSTSDLRQVVLEPPQKPDINVIVAKSLQNNKKGYKLIYIYEDETDITTYSSVEELVIYHYKELGYSRGMHAENKFVISIFGLLFWDIIYEHPVPDVFQSRYQSQPLDLKSKFFYLNRKDAIDARLLEMEFWTIDKIRDIVTSRHDEHKDKLSVVSWGLFSNIKDVVELLECIGMHVLSLLCERLARCFHVASSGFPDLVLWTPGQEHMCRFVEVKGQGDSLSMGQKLWMDYLMNIGADAEVCSVRRVGGQ